MKCWKCARQIEVSGPKMGFRVECDGCGAAQHACINCKHYAPGKPNDCAVPGTDWIKDREGMNFCEEFALGFERKSKNDDAKAKARKLLGLDD